MSKGNLSMTEHDPTNALAESIEPGPGTLALADFGDDGFPANVSSELGSEDWPSQVVKRGIRLRTPTAILLALLFAAVGLWGGSVLRQRENSTSGTTGAAAARAAFSRAGGTASRFGATGGATTGTVTDIIGATLYVTNASGQLIKVTLSSSATVTRNASSSLSGLKPGDTVTVQGTAPKNGSMTASSVAATAKGVSSSAGFGAGGGFGGAFGGGAGGSSSTSQG